MRLASRIASFGALCLLLVLGFMSACTELEDNPSPDPTGDPNLVPSGTAQARINGGDYFTGLSFAPARLQGQDALQLALPDGGVITIGYSELEASLQTIGPETTDSTVVAEYVSGGGTAQAAVEGVFVITAISELGTLTGNFRFTTAEGTVLDGVFRNVSIQGEVVIDGGYSIEIIEEGLGGFADTTFISGTNAYVLWDSAAQVYWLYVVPSEGLGPIISIEVPEGGAPVGSAVSISSAMQSQRFGNRFIAESSLFQSDDLDLESFSGTATLIALDLVNELATGRFDVTESSLLGTSVSYSGNYSDIPLFRIGADGATDTLQMDARLNDFYWRATSVTSEIVLDNEVITGRFATNSTSVSPLFEGSALALTIPQNALLEAGVTQTLDESNVTISLLIDGEIFLASTGEIRRSLVDGRVFEFSADLASNVDTTRQVSLNNAVFGRELNP